MATWVTIEQLGSDLSFLASLKDQTTPETHEISGVVQISEIASKLWSLGWQIHPAPPMPIFQDLGADIGIIAMTFVPVEPFIQPDGGVKEKAWIQIYVHHLTVEDYNGGYLSKLDNLEHLKAIVNIREAR